MKPLKKFLLGFVFLFLGLGAYIAVDLQILGTNNTGQNVFLKLLQATAHTCLHCITLSLGACSLSFVFAFCCIFSSKRGISKMILLLFLFLEMTPVYFLIFSFYAFIQKNIFLHELLLIIFLGSLPFKAFTQKMLSFKNSDLVLSYEQLGCSGLYTLRSLFFPLMKPHFLNESYLVLIQAITLEINLGFLGLSSGNHINLGLFFAEASVEMLYGNFQELIGASLSFLLILLFFKCLKNQVTRS